MSDGSLASEKGLISALSSSLKISIKMKPTFKKQQFEFTCIGKGHGAPCLPAGQEEWEALRREPWLAQMCARIEKGDDELKHRLPVWTPHCAEFKDNHRAIADAVKPLN